MDNKIDRRTLSENKIGKVGAKKKDIADKVVAVTAYIPRKHIDGIGGIAIARSVAKGAIMSIKKKIKN